MNKKSKKLVFLLFQNLVFALSTSCNHFFYQPTQVKYSSPEDYQLSFEEFLFPVEEAVNNLSLQNTLNLHGILLHAQSQPIPRGTILFFHGNAQNLSSHFHHVSWLTGFGYDVMIFDYRGYGKSEGVPDQEGVKQDAIAAIHQTKTLQQKRKSRKLILYGHSLGGTIALTAISELGEEEQKKISGVIIESSFSSYRAIAKSKLQEAWFFAPFALLAPLLISDQTAPKELLSTHLHIPLLVVHGDQDPVVPLMFGEEIFETAQSPKWMIKVEGGDHNNIFHYHPNKDEWRKKLVSFIDGNNHDQ